MSIKIKNLVHYYMKGTPFEKKALDNINIDIQDGEFIALIGHTGSGKSTLIQHINGLLKPNQGSILIDDLDITKGKVKLSDIRKKVGLVFQFPEYALFEETIEKDVAFGPKNLGLNEEEIKQRVIRSLNIVGMNYEVMKDKSPFDLSGGQKRRVAIAGILALEPKVLILDEPTAGLDPKGRDEILSAIKELHNEYGLTTILVSHSMEDVVKLADRVIVMNKGQAILNGPPSDIFKEIDLLESVGLGVPEVAYLIRELRVKGFDLPEAIYTVEEAKEAILRCIRGGNINA